jgi:hypothetical protein
VSSPGAPPIEKALPFVLFTSTRNPRPRPGRFFWPDFALDRPRPATSYEGRSAPPSWPPGLLTERRSHETDRTDRVARPGSRRGGDRAIVVYFSPREIKPRGKIECVYAYGQGTASNPENEGKVSVAFGGSFEPKKLFTLTAYVDEPLEGQSLALRLPAGMELVEGKAVQPVPPPAERGTSIVLWKARVLKTGRFPVHIRSSNGVTYTRTVTVSPSDAGGKRD